MRYVEMMLCIRCGSGGACEATAVPSSAIYKGLVSCTLQSLRLLHATLSHVVEGEALVSYKMLEYVFTHLSSSPRMIPFVQC